MQGSILVADDEPWIVHFIQENLERCGYRVETAKDGKEALARIKADRPDLLITDVMMPKMDGFELRSKLRDDPVFKDLPIVMLIAISSESPSEEDQRDNAERYKKHIASGVDDLMPKPFTPKELIQVVKRFVPMP